MTTPGLKIAHPPLRRDRQRETVFSFCKAMAANGSFLVKASDTGAVQSLAGTAKALVAA